MKDRNWYKDKNILVVGMGRSGVATLEVLHQLGSKVFIQDEKTFDKLSEDVKSQIEGKKTFEGKLEKFENETIFLLDSTEKVYEGVFRRRNSEFGRI